MLKIMNKEEEGWLTEDDYRNFPKEELRIIDQLWLKYSNNKFGFSVQKKIWLNLLSKLDVVDYYDAYFKLADQVGFRKGGKWLSYSDLDLTFNISAPEGHLPWKCLEHFRIWGGGDGVECRGKDILCSLEFLLLFSKL